MTIAIAEQSGSLSIQRPLRLVLGYCAMQFAFVAALLFLAAAAAVAFVNPARRSATRFNPRATSTG